MRTRFLLMYAAVSLTAPVDAAVLKFEKGLRWVSNRDLTSQQFSQKFEAYKSQGYMMIDIDAYPTGSGTRYSMVWRENTDGRRWAEYRDMTGAKYGERWQEFKNKLYRPLDIESYRAGAQQRFAGIWVENKEGYAWSSKRGLTSEEYGSYFQQQREKGFRPIDIEAYSTANGIRYAAIWVQNQESVEWLQLRDMSRATYQQKVDQQAKNGFLVVDFESYTSGSKQRYAAIWEKRSGFAQQVRTNRTANGFANQWRQYLDEGYRLVDFERYDTPSGSRYGGIWIENASRYRYGRKGKLDTIVKKYRSDNKLPGISVAVVRNGQMIYRRGFGWADKENKKVAHGDTVYPAASVSKIIGGTIAVNLQHKGRLRNGRAIDLDLSKRTRSYLSNVEQSDGDKVTLPARHKHKVAQLFSHLGCIQHYSGPEPSSGHYVLAIDALPQIWNADFVDECAVGANRNYSTHAFTYLAAVLEQVTGRTSAQLIRSEIARPYGLTSMRAQWGLETLASNYDRAVPYKDNGDRSSYSDNSWKIFGGGIEVSPVDLAWFGWKVLDGRIVDSAVRDDVLWKRVNSNTVNGIAWEIRSVDSRRVAEHGGSWSGARCHLQVYRDDGLVVVVMSNRSNHTVGSVRGLSRKIADAVLAP